MPTNTRHIIRTTTMSELIVGCPAKVPHLLADRPRPQHWTAARGSALHAAMQDLMTERMNGTALAFASVRERFCFTWADEREKVEDWSFDGGTVKPDEVEARTLEMLHTLYLATKDVQPLLVEQTWSWDIPGTDYTLQGTIDCISYHDHFGIVINDWKSAAKPWGRYKKAHQWQHMGYRLLFEHNAGKLVTLLNNFGIPSRFWWWSVDEMTGEVQRIEHVYAKDAVAHAEREAIGAIRQLSQDYLPTKNDPDICKYCDFLPSGCLGIVEGDAA